MDKIRVTITAQNDNDLRRQLIELYQRIYGHVDQVDQMTAMKMMCIYRINGCCWDMCVARDFCQPERGGLLSVNDLFEGGVINGMQPAIRQQAAETV